MTKKHPLFIFDTNRTHRFGDCDWLACIDIYDGFIAQVTYETGLTPMLSLNECISAPNTNGVQVHIQVKRAWSSPDYHRSGLSAHNQMHDVLRYVINATKGIEIDTDALTSQQVIDCLQVIVHANKHSLADESIPDQERKTTMMSLKVIESAIQKLTDYASKRD